MTERAESRGSEPVKPPADDANGGSGSAGTGGSGTLPPPPAPRGAAAASTGTGPGSGARAGAGAPAADTETLPKADAKAGPQADAKAGPQGDSAAPVGGAGAAGGPAATGAASNSRSGAGTTAPAASRPGRGKGAADEELPSRAGDLGPRRVRLAVSRVDPWSVAMVSFLLSVALGIMFIVATVILWFLLDSMHVFASIEELFVSVGSESFGQLIDYVRFDRVLTMAALVAIVDVVLLTALATLCAFLYNIAASLVGGVHLTLTDD